VNAIVVASSERQIQRGSEYGAPMVGTHPLPKKAKITAMMISTSSTIHPRKPISPSSGFSDPAAFCPRAVARTASAAARVREPAPA
jgi:hypothetical protein